ncbi:MAG: hypothetical protein ACKPKO_32660, partial [Candidatus Fonsibacter sp.]
LFDSPNSNNNTLAIKVLKEYQGWPNLVGEHINGYQATDWAIWLVNWKEQHWNEAVTTPTARGDRLQFHSVVVVIIDDHNALIDGSGRYLGVRGNEQALLGYRRYFTELQSFSKVIYGCSDCPERFPMNP